jgi:PhnB protein
MKATAPYLFFNGECADAMNFYKEVFGGELTLMRYGDAPAGSESPGTNKNRIMHSRLMNDAFTLLASDVHEGEAKKGNYMQLYQEFDSMAGFEQAYSALSRGGSVFQEPHNAFWGSRFAMLTDKFGFSWMLSTPLQK